MPAPTEATPEKFALIDRTINNTVAAYGKRLVPGAGDMAAKLLREQCLGRDLDTIPGMVAEFLENHPVGKRLANAELDPESRTARESLMRVAARAHGVREELLGRFAAAHSAGAAFVESTRAMFDYVGRALDDDTTAEKFLANPVPDARIGKARAVLAKFRDHLVGDLDELARGPFKDIGSMPSKEAFDTVFNRITNIPHFYAEHCRGGQPAAIHYGDVEPDPAPTRESLTEQFGTAFADRYSNYM